VERVGTSHGCRKMMPASFDEPLYAKRGCWTTYLEKRLSIRPAGVVSKKLIGLLKMAKAILSCNLREAWNAGNSVSLLDLSRDYATCSRRALQNLTPTYFDGAEDPQN